jgi:hypothetical protein
MRSREFNIVSPRSSRRTKLSKTCVALCLAILSSCHPTRRVVVTLAPEPTPTPAFEGEIATTACGLGWNPESIQSATVIRDQDRKVMWSTGAAGGPGHRGTIVYGQDPSGWHTSVDAQPLEIGVRYEVLLDAGYVEFMMDQSANGETSITITSITSK